MLAFKVVLAATAASADPLAVGATVHELENGLTVVLEEQHRTDTVALHLHYGVGSRDERDGELGCAHLFEHVMFEGSANVPANGFDEWLTSAGGWNNAFTSEDETAYHMEFPSGALDLALFLESDRMGFLLGALTDETLDNQRRVVLQERAEDYAEPNGRDLDALSRLHFPDSHPYHHPVIGTVSDVEGFNLASVRQFWQRHYRPRNAVLGLVGHFDSEDALARVRYWFSDVPDSGPATPRTRPDAEWPRSKASRGVVEDRVDNGTIYLSWPTVPVGHADEPALHVLSWVLAGGRGTRLADRLYYRSGLALETDAMHWSADIDGMFFALATVETRRMGRVVKIVERELQRLVRKPPGEPEVERARQTIKSGILDALEQPASRAEMLVDCQRRYGKPDCLIDRWALYEAVAPEDIRRVVRTYLVPERRVALWVVPEGEAASAPRDARRVELP